jgi:hypothetical protein
LSVESFAVSNLARAVWEVTSSMPVMLTDFDWEKTRLVKNKRSIVAAGFIHTSSCSFGKRMQYRI